MAALHKKQKLEEEKMRTNDERCVCEREKERGRRDNKRGQVCMRVPTCLCLVRRALQLVGPARVRWAGPGPRKTLVARAFGRPPRGHDKARHVVTLSRPRCHVRRPPRCPTLALDCLCACLPVSVSVSVYLPCP
jgi:hypothetical protein